MIISAATDYRKASKKTLPPFLYHYIDGGSYAEYTLQKNRSDLDEILLKQRVLNNVASISTQTSIFNETLDLPVVLAPVGLTGMYARRGEVQAAQAAENQGVPFTLSTVSICSIEEVASQINRPLWFQLYVLKDHGFMKNVLERAWENGVKTLVFTVDLPTPGARYRDAHSGMSGPSSSIRRIWQAMLHPKWAFDVGINGKPHDLGNISHYLGAPIGLEDYIGWIAKNFDPSVSWKDLVWIRDFWKGNIVLKGILDPDDAKAAVDFGADGLVVSNHGGRQLDSVLSSAKALPMIADAVKGQLTLFADSGVQTGLDVVKMLALGADAVMIGRAYAYALSVDGQEGVSNLLSLLKQEMKVAMMLTGTNDIKSINNSILASNYANIC